jgi:acylphosphatase
MNARLLVISGRVHGVGFRDWMVARARALGLAGWVRNRPDGLVEALVAGNEDAVEEMLRACRRGPPAAEVESITEEWADAPETPGFYRR